MLNAVKAMKSLAPPELSLPSRKSPTCRGLGSISQIPAPPAQAYMQMRHHMQSLVPPPVLHETPQKECTYFFLMNISSSVGLFFLTTVTPTGGLAKPGLAALPLRAGPSSPDSVGPDAEDNPSSVCGGGFTAAAERWPLAEVARLSDVFWALGPLGASGG